MKLPIFQVDAFTDQVLRGNPAAVCPLTKMLPDQLMLSIARENNLSETAFLTGSNGTYRIRWFTPAYEVPLCGHATLASAVVIREFLEPGRDRISFESASGVLGVTYEQGWYELDFPADPGIEVSATPELIKSLGCEPKETRRSSYYFAVFESEQQISDLKPDFASMTELDRIGVIVTAPGSDIDFVSRFFAPQAGINEDPVTGSAHCTLTPYWSARLGKNHLEARQISARGGYLKCTMNGDRVGIAGQAAIYMQGEIRVPDIEPGSVCDQVVTTSM